MRKVSYVKWLPVVNRSLCTGCNQCVLVCDSKSLELFNGLISLERPDSCGSEGHCVTACPKAAIHMCWVDLNGNRKRGKWGSSGPDWTSRVRGGHYRA